MTPGALFTDLYELTMMAGYTRAGMAGARATFDMFFRRPPEGVTLIVAAGQELALDHLERLRFTAEDCAWLEQEGTLPHDFLASLEGTTFTGDVWAVPEGTPVFSGEPVLRVEAPLALAQVVETALLNAICYSSLVASNAAEVRDAADGRAVAEFGARRAHGPDGALSASRASFVGGCDSTSNVAAGKAFGIPVSGTQAHSWVMAFPTELASFRAYADAFPDRCILLVDTYDTLKVGVPNAITVGLEMATQGRQLAGIRLDSGDLAALARGARQQLDAAGLGEVRIVASGDLDAGRIRDLLARDAPIDAFGVGTSLVTAKQDPTISGVYKLAELDGEPVLKVSSSPEKATDPGRKQVWRSADGDVIGLADEGLPGTPLLEPVMREGRRLHAPPALTDVRDRCTAACDALRDRVWQDRWPVRRSERLRALREEVFEDVRDGVRGG